MTHRLKPAFTLALSLLLAFGLTACALPFPRPGGRRRGEHRLELYPQRCSVQQTGSYVVSVSDMAGNAVQLSAYPSKIVVLDPADCEILAIGRGRSRDRPQLHV